MNESMEKLSSEEGTTSYSAFQTGKKNISSNKVLMNFFLSINLIIYFNFIDKNFVE